MSKISNIIGIATIIFTFLTIISVILPSLFLSIFGKFSSTLIPYEIGIFGIPIILSNAALFLFGILYYKKKLPISFLNYINKIRTFEIPKKPSIVILLIIFSVYIGLSLPELFIDESQQWGDYAVLDEALDLWPDGKSENIYVEEQNDRYVRMFLLDLSLNLFQNIKILPFLASILVVFFTYLLTVQITEKRFAGIISILVLLQSNTFLRFDTVAVYENFWILFYLLSLYVVQKKWFFSPAFYILSFFTKAFVAPYFIMTIYYAFQSPISSKKKIGIVISYIVIVILSIGIIFLGDTVYPNVIQIDSSKFFTGISTLGLLLRYDYLLLLIILPVVVGLTILAKSSFKQIDSIIMLIFGTMLAGPLLVMFTNFYEILPYRFVPLIVFFAIGVGLFFANSTKNNTLKN